MTDSVLLTGAGGFLGQAFQNEFPGRVHRLSADLIHCSEAELKDYCSQSRTLVHLAGKVSRRQSDLNMLMQLHVDGTRKLLNAAKASGVKRIVLSSTSGTVALFENESGKQNKTRDETPAEIRCADESFPYAIDTAAKVPYYLSKIYQEKCTIDFCRKNMLECIILRPSLLLGPGDTRRSSTGIVEDFLNRKIPLIPPGNIAFTDVRDTARAFIRALDRKVKPGEVEVFLINSENMTLKDFFHTLENITGIQAPSAALNRRMHGLAGRFIKEGTVTGRLFERISGAEAADFFNAGLYWYCSSAKAKAEGLFETRPYEQTLKDTVDDLKRNPLTF